MSHRETVIPATLVTMLCNKPNLLLYYVFVFSFLVEFGKAKYFIVILVVYVLLGSPKSAENCVREFLHPARTHQKRKYLKRTEMCGYAKNTILVPIDRQYANIPNAIKLVGVPVQEQKLNFFFLLTIT